MNFILSKIEAFCTCVLLLTALIIVLIRKYTTQVTYQLIDWVIGLVCPMVYCIVIYGIMIVGRRFLLIEVLSSSPFFL